MVVARREEYSGGRQVEELSGGRQKSYAVQSKIIESCLVYPKL